MFFLNMAGLFIKKMGNVLNSWIKSKACLFIQKQGFFFETRINVKVGFRVSNPIVSKHMLQLNLMTQQHYPISSICTTWYMYIHSLVRINIPYRVMMVLQCGIYGLSFPHHLTRRDIRWTINLIHESVCLAMGFSPCSFVGNRE
jgi:hypothetical protein